MKIQMLDETGTVYETCEATATPEAEEAFCEDGESAMEASKCSGPVYRWTMADGMTFQACDYHLLVDEFARLIEG
jgi:hypothetical protein